MCDVTFIPPVERTRADKTIRSKHFLMFNKEPVRFASSSTHIVLTTRRDELFSLGSNKSKQIVNSDTQKFAKSTLCDWITGSKVAELACGVEFTAVISKDGKIVIHGIENKTYDALVRPRGLSARGSRYAFAHGIEGVIIGDIGKPERNVKTPESIIMTAVCGADVGVLDQYGVCYVIRSDGSINRLGVAAKVKRMTACGDIFIMLGQDHCVYVGSDVGVSAYHVPRGTKVESAIAQSGMVIARDKDGDLFYAMAKDLELKPEAPQEMTFKIPERSRYATLEANDYGIVLVDVGLPKKPSMLTKPVPMKPGTHIKSINEDFVYSVGGKSYFTKSVFETVKVAGLAERELSSVFCSATGRMVEIADNPAVLMEWNLMKGDKIIVPRDEDDELVYEIIGYGEGSIWVREAHEHCVRAISGSVDGLWSRVKGFSRPGHTMERVLVEGKEQWVDTTPELCASFGYEPDDLIWHGSKGIVEFFGIYAGRLVFMDIGKRSLFAEDCVQFKVVRRTSNRLPHTRSVVKIDGTIVELDISAIGRKLFKPTDRVQSPYGEATVLGFADGIYIQTDEMRMNGYEAVDADAFELKLVRRIHGIAERTYLVDGAEQKVSLDTEDSVLDVLPGDKIIVDGRWGSVVGFVGENAVARFLNEENCTVIISDVEIFYRADILATRVSHDYKPVEVGSPHIQESMVLPGDIVENEQLGTIEFLGCCGNQTIFISRFTGSVYTLSYSLLMCSEFFKVLSRPAFPDFDARK